MIFDLVPNLLSSLISILFPVFASYKALRTSDPAQLSPWLMYWVSFTLITLFDNYTYFILSFIPLYSTLRLFVLLYLVLPQTQGARLLYQSHIHPFLAHHEARIDRLISDAHDRLRAAGLDYLHDAIAYVKRTLLGIQDETAQHRQSAATTESYAQSLLARFNLPSARQGLAAPASDFYGLLSAATGSLGLGGGGGVSAASRDAQIEELGRSGTLIPAHIKGASDRARFVGQQREKLRVLLGALDQEAGELEIQRDVEKRMGGLGGEPLVKSKSEVSFERIDKEEVGDGSKERDRSSGAGAGAGGWLGWAFGSGEGTGKGKEEPGVEGNLAYGTSSGVDRGI